jgi:hypothetical protein
MSQNQITEDTEGGVSRSVGTRKTDRVQIDRGWGSSGEPPSIRTTESGRRTHDLKTLSLYYREVIAGRKPFEVRLNDREFHESDSLNLRETTPTGTYTGWECLCEVTYILRGKRLNATQNTGVPGIEPGYVVMGIRHEHEWKADMDGVNLKAGTAERFLYRCRCGAESVVDDEDNAPASERLDAKDREIRALWLQVEALNKDEAGTARSLEEQNAQVVSLRATIARVETLQDKRDALEGRLYDRAYRCGHPRGGCENCEDRWAAYHLLREIGAALKGDNA